jgi:hypothetical protein
LVTSVVVVVEKPTPVVEVEQPAPMEEVEQPTPVVEVEPPTGYTAEVETAVAPVAGLSPRALVVGPLPL